MKLDWLWSGILGGMFTLGTTVLGFYLNNRLKRKEQETYRELIANAKGQIMITLWRLKTETGACMVQLYSLSNGKIDDLEGPKYLSVVAEAWAPGIDTSYDKIKKIRVGETFKQRVLKGLLSAKRAFLKADEIDPLFVKNFYKKNNIKSVDFIPVFVDESRKKMWFLAVCFLVGDDGSVMDSDRMDTDAASMFSIENAIHQIENLLKKHPGAGA